jgi:TonB family protein
MQPHRLCALLVMLTMAPSMVCSQECPLGPADSLPNASFGATVAHWPWSPGVVESAARAVFRDFGYEIAEADSGRFTTRVSRREPSHPLLRELADGPHPGVVLTLEILPAGDSASTRLAAVAQCALDYPSELRAEDTYEFVLAEEFLTHLIAEATLRGTPGSVGFHVLGPAGMEQQGPLREWCPPLAYPSALLDRNIEGRARVAYVVDQWGQVDRGSIEVLDATHPEFGDAAVSMVRECRFIPAEVDGSYVSARSVMPVVFQLQPPPDVPPTAAAMRSDSVGGPAACFSAAALAQDTLNYGIPTGGGPGYSSMLWLWQEADSLAGWFIGGERGFQIRGAPLREPTLDGTRTVLTARVPSTDEAEEALLEVRVACDSLWGTLEYPWGRADVRYERIPPD